MHLVTQTSLSPPSETDNALIFEARLCHGEQTKILLVTQGMTQLEDKYIAQ